MDDERGPQEQRHRRHLGGEDPVRVVDELRTHGVVELDFGAKSQVGERRRAVAHAVQLTAAAVQRSHRGQARPTHPREHDQLVLPLPQPRAEEEARGRIVGNELDARRPRLRHHLLLDELTLDVALGRGEPDRRANPAAGPDPVEAACAAMSGHQPRHRLGVVDVVREDRLVPRFDGREAEVLERRVVRDQGVERRRGDGRPVDRVHNRLAEPSLAEKRHRVRLDLEVEMLHRGSRRELHRDSLDLADVGDPRLSLRSDQIERPIPDRLELVVHRRHDPELDRVEERPPTPPARVARHGQRLPLRPARDEEWAGADRLVRDRVVDPVAPDLVEVVPCEHVLGQDVGEQRPPVGVRGAETERHRPRVELDGLDDSLVPGAQRVVVRVEDRFEREDEVVGGDGLPVAPAGLPLDVVRERKRL